MKRTGLAIAPVVALAVLLGACGGGDAVKNAGGARTIDIDMRDNDFSQASITVKAGEQIQFVFHNKGAVTHDAYIGDDARAALRSAWPTVVEEAVVPNTNHFTIVLGSGAPAVADAIRRTISR